MSRPQVSRPCELQYPYVHTLRPTPLAGSRPSRGACNGSGTGDLHRADRRGRRRAPSREGRKQEGRNQQGRAPGNANAERKITTSDRVGVQIVDLDLPERFGFNLFRMARRLPEAAFAVCTCPDRRSPGPGSRRMERTGRPPIRSTSCCGAEAFSPRMVDKCCIDVRF